jgi:hypothetical protein
MATVYRKSAKGVDEIATRANRLPPRLRSALILVDGMRSDADLSKLILQQPVETLHELQAQGFIEVVGTVDDQPRISRPAPLNSRAAPLDRQPPERANQKPADKDDFAKYRSAVLRAFNDLTGPTGEGLAMKMEKTQSREQLAPLMETAYRIIANAQGSERANDFKARFASF